MKGPAEGVGTCTGILSETTQRFLQDTSERAEYTTTTSSPSSSSTSSCSSKPKDPAPLDIYTILKSSPHSTPDDMKRAVRVRHIETHPDKRKRQVLSKEEEDTIDEGARLVGWATDILLDPERRHKHDE